MDCKIGVLWDTEVEWNRNGPFQKDTLNHTYSVFSRIAKEKGGEVYLAKYTWYDEGKLEQAHYFNGESWEKVENVEIDVVFDKYKFDEDTRELKQQIQVELPVLNRFELEEICKDKLMSYRKFTGIVPETREADRETVEEMLEEHGRVILKPQFDFGGRGIKVIDSMDDFRQMPNQLVQQFIDSSHGIPSLDIEGVHDLRVLVANGEPVGAYVREPNGNGWISNVSRGGTMEFFELEEVPEKAMDIVDEVRDEFDRFNPSYYSVDMIFDEDENPWILEFNSKPGFNFYNDDEIEKHKRPAMEKVVETLVDMGR